MLKKLLFTPLLVLSLSIYAQADSWIDATEESPYDCTSIIKNASCTENFGWLLHSSNAAADYQCHNPEFDSGTYNGVGIEAWFWNPIKNAILMWQDIENVLPGKYILKAYSLGQVYNNAAKKGKNAGSIYLFANNEKTLITASTWEEYTVEVIVDNSCKLKIGICTGDDNENDWTGLANVRLYCVRVDGEAQFPKIGLSENNDVRVVTSDGYQDVSLKILIPQDCYRTLCLPFNMSETLAKEYFSDIQQITAFKRKGAYSFQPTLTEVMNIKAGQLYIVKAKKDIERIVVQQAFCTASPSVTYTVGSFVMAGTYRAYSNWATVHLYDPSTGLFTRTQKRDNGKGYSVYVK